MFGQRLALFTAFSALSRPALALQPGAVSKDRFVASSFNEVLKAFTDLSESPFSGRLREWGYVGKPLTFVDTPSFVDLDGDGVLDFLYPNHFRPQASQFFSVGNCGIRGRFQPYVCDQMAERVLDFDGESADLNVDLHGAVFADFDGDGNVDLHISVGGDRGKSRLEGPHRHDHDNLLLWGTRMNGSTRLVGGQAAARAAGVEMSAARGRFAYVADFNGDGFLDMFYVVDRRVMSELAPGRFSQNTGQRTFAPPASGGIQEFAKTVIMTDADGDGHAEEFVVQRGPCYPQQYYPSDTFDWSAFEDGSSDYAKFCDRRPQGTTAVYKLVGGSMREVSPGRKTSVQAATPQGCEHGSWPGAMGCHGVSSDSGDLDGDGLADLVVAYSDRVRIFYSSARKWGQLPLETSAAEVLRPPQRVCQSDKHCLMGVRLVDLDNDGRLELMMIVRGLFNVSSDGPFVQIFSYSTPGINKDWNLVSSDLMGDLSSATPIKMTEGERSDACRGAAQNSGHMMFAGIPTSIRVKLLSTLCNAHSAEVTGVSLVDLNNDGFVDVVACARTGRCRFFANRLGVTGRFIHIQLHGQHSGNAQAIGATVILRTTNGETQLREQYSAQRRTEFGGMRDERIVFGLGSHGMPKTIIVRWPGRQESVVTFVPSSHTKHLSNMSLPLHIYQSR